MPLWKSEGRKAAETGPQDWKREPLSLKPGRVTQASSTPGGEALMPMPVPARAGPPRRRRRPQSRICSSSGVVGSSSHQHATPQAYTPAVA